MEQPTLKNTDFSFALRVMKGGARFRRAHWTEGFAIHLDKDKGGFFSDNKILFKFYHKDLIADDWEEYKE